MSATALAQAEVLPLENGDRLTRVEFERRWATMPKVQKAELIDGVVYMPSAVRYRRHSRPHADMQHWLGTYSVATPGVEVGDNPTIRLDEDNAPQPDLLLRIPESLGGHSFVDEEDYLNGAPELIVEIAGSTASYDLHQKLDVYRRHGVREYLVWRTLEAAIDWFVLQEGRFTPLAADADGVSRSRFFPGLWLDAPAMLRSDLGKVVELLNRGLATAEHEQFVGRLRR